MVWLAHITESGADALRWTRLPGGEAVRGTPDAFAQAIRAEAPGDPVALLVPSTRVLVAQVATPVRNARQLQQALPFLVEEFLATDVDRMHIVAGGRARDGRLTVLAIERNWLAATLAALADAGIDPDLVTVDAAPLLQEADVAIHLAGAASVLWADGTLLSLREEDVASAISALDAGQPRRVVVHVSPASSNVAADALVVALRSGFPGWEIDVDPDAGDCYALAAAAVATQALPPWPNLRQGEFAPAHRAGDGIGFNWRPLAALAAACAITWVGFQGALALTHDRAADALRDRQVGLYRELFPEANNVPDPRRQMEGRLGGDSGDSQFLRLVAESSAAISGLSAGGSGRFDTRALGWEAAQGVLRLDVVARNLEDLESLRAALESRGLAVEVGSGVAQDGGYRARINLKGGA